MKWTNLYKISTVGTTQVWAIGGDVESGQIHIKWGQLGGAMQEQVDKVQTNNSGRSIREQIILEMKSRIVKQQAKGYRTTTNEAKLFRNKNALNLPKPMLAQRFDKVSGIDYDACFRQFKYDGHRMLVTKVNGELIAYSRNGKIIDTLDHILEGIQISEGVVLDGEVYHHGVPLQVVASWCKRKQPQTLKLNYFVYDVMMDAPYAVRLDFLRFLKLGDFCQIAHTWKNIGKVTEDLASAREQGYEGIMLRSHRGNYESGKRSAQLIKVKQTLDDEFAVVGIHESADGWAVLECVLNNSNQTFKVSAPGTIENKTMILKNRDEYIGKTIRVEYFSETLEGKPFHPVAMEWRNKFEE
jgi:ATP-dependent DNA ligase